MNNTGIRLEFAQVISNDEEQTFEVVKIKALRKEELPQEYLNGNAPVVYQVRDNALHLRAFGQIFVGTTLSECVLQHHLSYIRAAGDHLTRVNKELKKKQLEQKSRIVFVDGREVEKTPKNKKSKIIVQFIGACAGYIHT